MQDDKTDSQTARKVTVVERVAIAMTYDGKRRDWSTDMTDFGKQWWLTKARIGLNEVNRIIQAKHK